MKKILMITFILTLSSCSTFNDLSRERQDQIEFRAFSAKDQSGLNEERQIKDPEVAACYRGKISETLEKVRQDLAQEDKSKWLHWSKMAACHFLEGETNLAIYYNQLIIKEFSSSKTSRAFPYNNMGVIYFEKDMPEQAEAYMLQAKRISPNSVSVQYNLSSLYMHYGEFDKAMPIFNRLKSEIYKNKEIFYSYALALTYKGQFSTLSKELKRFAGDTKDFDKLEVLEALKDFVTGERLSAYNKAKNIKGRYLSSVEEKALDKIIDDVEEELAAKEKVQVKKSNNKKETKNEK